MSPQEQLEQVEKALAELDSVEHAIRLQAENRGYDPLMMRTMDGDFMMIPILVARAQLLPLVNTLQSQIAVEETGEKFKGWLEGLGGKPPEESQ